MGKKQYHPGRLHLVWYDLPVCGTDAITGKTIEFLFENIAWDTEGIEDGCIIVCLRQQESVVERKVLVSSMALINDIDDEYKNSLYRMALSILSIAKID